MFQSCRQSLARVARPCSARTFATSAWTLAPKTSFASYASPSSPASNSAARPGAASALIDILDRTVARSEQEEEQATSETFLLSNLSENSVISPRSLSPNYLLTPYLPRPDLSRAFPLGPPTTEKYTLDPFLTTGISPMASPMNPYLRAEFCTSMGKIKSRGKTQLQRRSQRALGKAVRRARSMGIVAVFGTSLPSRLGRS